MGHTQPGTGDIAHAISRTLSKSTSPWTYPFTNVLPTSTTTAPGFTISAVINRGFPIATMRTSALPVISARFGVLLLQLVTVAHALMAMRLIGFPTMFDRPRMTTCLPSSGILYHSRSFLIPFGVQDTSPESSPRKRFPILVRVNQSTSLRGSIASTISR